MQGISHKSLQRGLPVAAPCTTNSNLVRRPFTSRPQRRSSSSTVCQVEIKDAGASGYAVGGFRPTSPKAWEMISTTLRKNKVKMISPQELLFAQKRGIPIIDIRPEGEHTKGRIPSALNVQFFRLINGWDPMQIARRATYAFFGILNGTEYNPEFFNEFEAAVKDKRKGVVVYCNIGGTLDPVGPSEFGTQSRSLTAAYELLRAGYSNVQVLKEGYAGWVKSEREVEFEE